MPICSDCKNIPKQLPYQILTFLRASRFSVGSIIILPTKSWARTIFPFCHFARRHILHLMFIRTMRLKLKRKQQKIKSKLRLGFSKATKKTKQVCIKINLSVNKLINHQSYLPVGSLNYPQHAASKKEFKQF